jgi:hypothetical protein
MSSAADLINLYKKIVTEKSPDNFYSCNLGGGLKESGLDQWQLTREALWYTADNQSRSGVIAPVWQDAQQVKFAHALMGGRPVAAVSASYARAGQVAWRNVADTSAEPECRMAQTAAAGGIVWYHWLGLEQGFNKDRRWQKVGRDFLSWHARHDKHFHNVASLARVAILASPRSLTLYQAPTNEDKTDAIQGIYAVLVEARIPFDFIHEEDLTSESGRDRLARYALLILPNVALLSDAQSHALERYVAHGGSLVATFETGLYDETGKPRTDFALGHLFGISKTGPRTRSEILATDPMASVHLQSIRQRGPITIGFEDTEWIAVPEWSIPLASIASPVMTMIKPYPVYPPEAVYMREGPTNSPSVVLQERGKSRLAYLSGDMDASYWRLDNADLGLQLKNVIRWALRDDNPIIVEGEGLMEICAWQTEPGFAIHMLNYNGPNAFRGRMRTPVTLGPQTLRLELPHEVKIKNASLLRAEMPLKFRQHKRAIEFIVSSVKAYEVAVLEV